MSEIEDNITTPGATGPKEDDLSPIMDAVVNGGIPLSFPSFSLSFLKFSKIFLFYQLTNWLSCCDYSPFH
jgi:hypothetical protein